MYAEAEITPTTQCMEKPGKYLLANIKGSMFSLFQFYTLCNKQSAFSLSVKDK